MSIKKIISELNLFFEQPIWQYEILGNSILEYTAAAAVFFVLLIIFKIFQTIIISRLNHFAAKTQTDIDDTLIDIIKTVRPRFYVFLSFYIAIRFIEFNLILGGLLNAILIIWGVFIGVAIIQKLINYGVHRALKQEDESQARTAIQSLNLIARIALWSLALLMVLSNLGIDVTSLIAGLGIGGVAVALALQNILGDLFSSFSIYFDKPFQVGDFIIIGEHMGVVEKIGIKTTRLRALQGEEIVISNSELTSTRVQNFKKMEERRVVFRFGVTYNTPNQKLEKIPVIVKNVIESIDDVRFDRSHFYKFNDSSLDFETVYYISSADYNAYMDKNQVIHLNIKSALEKEEIEFAFPTQTIHLAK